MTLTPIFFSVFLVFLAVFPVCSVSGEGLVARVFQQYASGSDCVGEITGVAGHG